MDQRRNILFELVCLTFVSLLAVSCSEKSIETVEGGIEIQSQGDVVFDVKGSAAISESFDFLVRNIGAETVRVASVESSCSCSTATPSKLKLEPGETAVIQAQIELNEDEVRRSGLVFVKYSNGQLHRFGITAARDLALKFLPETPVFRLKKGHVLQASVGVLEEVISGEHGKPVADSGLLFSSKQEEIQVRCESTKDLTKRKRLHKLAISCENVMVPGEHQFCIDVRDSDGILIRELNYTVEISGWLQSVQSGSEPGAVRIVSDHPESVFIHSVEVDGEKCKIAGGNSIFQIGAIAGGDLGEGLVVKEVVVNYSDLTHEASELIIFPDELSR